MNTSDTQTHETPPTPPSAGRQPVGGAAGWGRTTLASAIGGGFTALALFAAVQFGAFDAVANTRPAPMAVSPDPRLDRVLSLLESGRDCDSACLAELRGKADKSGALEQTLSQLQASAADALKRAETLETQRQELAERLARIETDLHASETQRNAVEQEKSDLTKRLAALRAGKPAKYDEPRGRGPREAVGTVPTAQAPVQPGPFPVAVSPDWKVLGMTQTTVVVSTPNHKVVALAVGEGLDGVTVRGIDSARGVVDTSAGTLAYKN